MCIRICFLVCVAMLPVTLIGQNLETLFSEGISKATMSITYMNQGNLETAKKLAKQASDIYHRIGFIQGYIGTSNVVARIHLQTGAADSARIIADQNMKIVQARSFEGISKAGTYFIKGAVSLSLGKIDSSILLLNASREIFDTLSNFLYVPEYLPDSLSFINDAVSVPIGRLLTEITRNSTGAKVYNFLGFAYLATLEFDQAEFYFKKALSSYQKTNSLPDQFSAHANLGLAFSMNSNRSPEDRFDSTMVQYHTALKLAEQGGSQALFFKGFAQRLIATTALKFGKNEVVATYYPPAYEILSDDKNGYLERMTLYPSEQIKTSLLIEFALVQATIGKPEEALKYLAAFSEQIQALEKTGMFVDRVLSAEINMTAAQTYSLLKDWQNAHLANQRALSALQLSFDDYEHPVFDAETFRPQPQTVDARVLYHIAKIFEAQAEDSQDLDKWQSAYDYYQLAMKHLDESRFYYLGITGQTFFNENALLNAEILLQSVNDALIKIGAELDSVPIEEMLLHFERGKAFVLRHAIARLEYFRSIPDSILQQDQFHKERLGALQQQIRKARNDTLYISLEKQWNAAQKEYAQFLDRLSKFYPDYYSLRYKEYILTPQSALNLLSDEGMAAIEYDFTDDNRLDIFWLTKDTMGYQHLDLPADFFDLIQNFKAVTASKNSADAPEVLDQYFKSANRLYDLLLAPLSGKMEEINHLIIVPDGQLHGVEFDYLLTKPVNSTISPEKFARKPAFDQLDLMVYKISCQYTNSLSTLETQSKLTYSQNEAKNWLQYGLFQPSFKDFSWQKELADFPLENSNAQLHELLNIDNILRDIPEPKHFWKAEEATMLNFRKAIDSFDFNILHIYSHGLLHPQNPLASGFLLAKPLERENRDMLRTSDLYNLNIRANLVIMNSCNSGNSNVLSGGEGLMSMGRGFFYSGCPSLILGRWPLVMEQTRIITQSFLEHLGNEMKISKALQKAKIDYLHNDSISRFDKAPFYWAGFSFWGVDQLVSFAK